MQVILRRAEPRPGDFPAFKPKARRNRLIRRPPCAVVKPSVGRQDAQIEIFEGTELLRFGLALGARLARVRNEKNAELFGHG